MIFFNKMKNTLQYDKKWHFIFGAFTGLLCIQDVLLSLVMVQMIALGKEIYDSCFPDKHTTDTQDYFATVAGGHFTLVVYFIVMKVLVL